jgi:hypothetical protein
MGGAEDVGFWAKAIAAKPNRTVIDTMMNTPFALVNFPMSFIKFYLLLN